MNFDLGPVCAVCGLERRDPDANHAMLVGGRLVVAHRRREGQPPHEFEPVREWRSPAPPPPMRASPRPRRRSSRRDPFASRRVA